MNTAFEEELFSASDAPDVNNERATRLRFTIFGEAQSKANSRQLVPTKNGKVRSIKSEKALAFEEAAVRQIPHSARVMWDCICGVRIRIFYRTQLPDLDASLVLDCLQARYVRKVRRNGSVEKILIQKGVVVNDRQFRQQHFYHAIDKRCPRCEITVWKLHATPSQGNFLAEI